MLLPMQVVSALDGGVMQMTPRNGWRGFEVITVGNNPAGDGYNWALPSSFDGIGAWIPAPNVLRLQLNHETADAAISEINLELSSFQTAVGNVIRTGATGGGSFVQSARIAYDRWSNNGGATYLPVVDLTSTSFYRFCSGQSYGPDTFGPGRGFVDPVYVTGEEGNTNRLFALDLKGRDFYRLSGTAGSAPGGVGGLPFDSYENAALIDTGETDHVALLLSPDGGTQTMKLYVGEKGKDAAGSPSNSFLARNGLAYGSYYYLNDSLPASGTSTDGFFDTTTDGALVSTKLEDVDASPQDPTKFVLGDEDSGLFTFDLALDFSSGSFSAATSSFSITKVQNHNNDVDGLFGDADNVDWTAPTALNGVVYPEGLLLANEDSGTANGETWIMKPDGGGLTKIADNIGNNAADESSGVLDVSRLVGYNPGSVILVSNQGSSASLSVLINPDATLASDFNNDKKVNVDDLTILLAGYGGVGPAAHAQGDATGDQAVDGADLLVWQQQYGLSNVPPGQSAVPEPAAATLLAATLITFAIWRRA